MDFKPKNMFLVSDGSQWTTAPFSKGLNYLYRIQSLAPTPEMINVMAALNQHSTICAWIGTYIDVVNAELSACLQACQNCFHPWERRQVEILAAPLVPSFGISGVCNFKVDPVTILVDVGHIASIHWLGVVAHEYAHAHAGYPGHHERFVAILSHLCLGLRLEAPPQQSGIEDRVRYWPPYPSMPDPLAFWKGENWPCRLNVMSYYSHFD